MKHTWSLSNGVLMIGINLYSSNILQIFEVSDALLSMRELVGLYCLVAQPKRRRVNINFPCNDVAVSARSIVKSVAVRRTPERVPVLLKQQRCVLGLRGLKGLKVASTAYVPDRHLTAIFSDCFVLNSVASTCVQG